AERHGRRHAHHQDRGARGEGQVERVQEVIFLRAGLRLRPFSFLAYDGSLRHGSKYKHVSREESLPMRVTLKVCALLTALCVLLPTATFGQKKDESPQWGGLAELNAKIERFAPTVI